MNQKLETKNTLTIAPETRQFLFHDSPQPTEYIVEAGGHLELFDLQLAKNHCSSTVVITLNGVNAVVYVYGLFFGTVDDTLTMSHIVKHHAPHTVSRLSTRGVLTGTAQASYTGDIHIPKGVVGCDGKQEAHTLLLSRDAHIDTVPHLEIGNNDVRCAHSVGVTYIDETKKFYCESRGLDENDAMRVIVQGHLSAILDRMENAEWKTQIEKMIEQKLNV